MLETNVENFAEMLSSGHTALHLLGVDIFKWLFFTQWIYCVYSVMSMKYRDTIVFTFVERKISQLDFIISSVSLAIKLPNKLSLQEQILLCCTCVIPLEKTVRMIA